MRFVESPIIPVEAPVRSDEATSRLVEGRMRCVESPITRVEAPSRLVEAESRSVESHIIGVEASSRLVDGGMRRVDSLFIRGEPTLTGREVVLRTLKSAHGFGTSHGRRKSDNQRAVDEAVSEEVCGEGTCNGHGR